MEMLERARASWPQVKLDERAYVRHLAHRLAPRGDVLAMLRSMHAGDLYLACAAASGDPHALGEIQRRLEPTALRQMRLRLEPSDLEDLSQSLGESLLVGREGRSAQITDYSGRGPLDRWLLAAVLHATQNARRGARELPAGIELGGEATQLGDPELLFIKELHRKDFSAAFRESFTSLSPKERNVLRLSLIDQLNIDRIGLIYRVHRATVARWLADAREKLLVGTRASLARRLRLDEGEIDSYVQLLRSQLEESLVRLVQTQGR
ncbi:MAG: hypothetical protein HY901_27510 [Deltaproteobacteria bacterium]|nr:hypothetical protein [Deltaproteobacteria bacterium]